MRSQYETQVFSAVIKYSHMQGEYLIETSSSIFSLTFPEGSYNLQKDTYDDWVFINNQHNLLIPFIENHQVTLISQKKYNQLCEIPDHR
ncbi:hypothetical protein I8751_02715 [Nostocaceae cyanobacterium CENA357]|uniref:Uncharacterized protein n=1 Tax=Atlanticothrix silvestris CENA357 TaxID=1725252 RepID=A0A8J7L200_9CYAN|nr:hypothetical protein [Atlanticothrix silvestris CENA357]